MLFFYQSLYSNGCYVGIAPNMLSKVVEAAERRLPVVIWLHGHQRTGCSEAFICSGAPMTSDVIFKYDCIRI